MDHLDFFKKTVCLVRQMMDNGQIRTLIAANGKTKFLILDEDYIEKSSNEMGIEMKSLNHILNFELPIYVTSILSDEPFVLFGDDIPLIAYNDEDTNIDVQEKKKLIAEKKRIVEDYLINNDLRTGYLIKSTSKVDCFAGIDWEVNEKIFDDSEGKMPNLRYAMLRLVISSSSFVPGILREMLGYKEDKLTITCNKSDIEHLIGILQNIKEALSKE